jgi:hypothetical protein
LKIQSNGFVLLFFDNLNAVKEYKSSECAQEYTISEPEPVEQSSFFILLLKAFIGVLAGFLLFFIF